MGFSAAQAYKSDPPHRRQTVFYTQDALTVYKGQSINGSLTCSPNARNNRDLDIVISYNVPAHESTPEQSDIIQYKMCVLPSSSRVLV